jgi:hypothetical protein
MLQDPSYKTPTNHEQARELKDPHDSLNTLSIQGNTSPTNQNALLSFPRIKGPTKHATDIGLRQVTQNQRKGPHTSLLAKGGGQGSAEPPVRPNCHWAPSPPASMWHFLVMSRSQFCLRPTVFPDETPLITATNSRGG